MEKEEAEDELAENAVSGRRKSLPKNASSLPARLTCTVVTRETVIFLFLLRRRMEAASSEGVKSFHGRGVVPLPAARLIMIVIV